MYLSKKTINILEEKLKLLNTHRPISSSIVKKIKEQFEIEMTYNSNAIEGNSLTLKETYLVISEGITIKGKPLKDHLEAKDHKEALDFLYELIDKDKKITVSEYLVRQLHQLVVSKSHSDIAGKYREGNVIITGSNHTPPEGFQIPHEMKELISWLNKDPKKHHVIELAALLHHKLVYIHPFSDGNGRMARLVMNVLIMKAGYPLAIILRNDRKRYYRILSEADEGRYEPLCEFIAQSVIRTLNIYLKVLTPSKKKNEKYISLEELSKGSPYSATYLRKLATQGKLEAFKEGRNWLSSKQALKDYIDSTEKNQ
ncbi:MAG: cell filamentation protein Fic [Candidatus Melainabacteria bacterium RIFCSPHIGHO2_02_FULL_34_12]|nr:MAG: cell filamentation protein Fic [Candidatus Melainabacteria bacterium RIFCSPHIGHO2_02_FULL_34_12]